MSDCRESARSHPTDPSGAGPEAPPRRLTRLIGSPTTRRLAVGRLAAVGAVLFSVLTLVVLGGSRMIAASIAWLHAQPPYRVAFRDIKLEGVASVSGPIATPAPPWIRSGAPGILERVRSRNHYAESVSVLDLDLAELAYAFQRESPWVRRVERVQRAARNRVTVRILYREPVAFVRIGNPSQPSRLYLDEDGVVLPADDLDENGAGVLIEIAHLLPAGVTGVIPECRPGRQLRLDSEDQPGSAQLVLGVARLAAFFRGVGAHEGKPRAPCRVLAIHHWKHQVYVELENQVRILWGPAPGTEPPGEPTTEQKWAALCEWFETHRLSDVPASSAFLTFSRGELVIVPIQRRG